MILGFVLGALAVIGVIAAIVLQPDRSEQEESPADNRWPAVSDGTLRDAHFRRTEF